MKNNIIYPPSNINTNKLEYSNSAFDLNLLAALEPDSPSAQMLKAIKFLDKDYPKIKLANKSIFQTKDSERELNINIATTLIRLSTKLKNLPTSTKSSFDNLNLVSKSDNPKRQQELSKKYTGSKKTINHLKYSSELAARINSYIHDQNNAIETKKSVAKHFNIAPSTFSLWVKQGKIKWIDKTSRKFPIKYSKDLGERINAYIQANPNLSIVSVAQHYNMSHTALRDWIKQGKIQWIGSHNNSKCKYSKDLAERINAYIQANPNLSIISVVQQFDISHTTLRTWIKNGKIQEAGNLTNKPRDKATRDMVERVNLYIQANPKLSQTKVAQQFNVSQRTISTWIKQGKIKWVDKTNRKSPIKYSIELGKRINAYIQANPNLSKTKVAEQFNISQPTLSTWIKQDKIKWVGKLNKKTGSKFTPELAERINLYIQANPKLSQTKVAQQFNVSQRTISTWIKQGKIKWVDKTNRKSPIKYSIELGKRINAYIQVNPNLSIVSVAQHFNMSHTALRKWIRNGKIKEVGNLTNKLPGSSKVKLNGNI